MDEPTVTNVTETLPTLEPDTRSKIKRGLLAVAAIGTAALLIDDQVKKFKNRKNVTVIVSDNDSTENPA